MCPNPTSLQTDVIALTQSYSSDVAFNSLIRWKCRDRRFLIRRRGTDDVAATTKSSRCNWSKERGNRGKRILNISLYFMFTENIY